MCQLLTSNYTTIKHCSEDTLKSCCLDDGESNCTHKATTFGTPDTLTVDLNTYFCYKVTNSPFLWQQSLSFGSLSFCLFKRPFSPVTSELCQCLTPLLNHFLWQAWVWHLFTHVTLVCSSPQPSPYVSSFFYPQQKRISEAQALWQQLLTERSISYTAVKWLSSIYQCIAFNLAFFTQMGRDVKLNTSYIK